MTKLFSVVCLAVAVSVASASCGQKLPPVTGLPAAVASADQDVKAGAAKAKLMLIAAGRLMLTISDAETRASKEGAVPPEADAVADRLFLAYVDLSREAMKKIDAGLSSWSDLRAAIEPVVAQVNRLIEWANTAQAIRERLSTWLTAVKDIFVGGVKEISPALGEAMFGGAR